MDTAPTDSRRLNTRAVRRAPRVTVTWTSREWTKAERMQLAQILFGPRPEVGP
ncbi:hypothetical protein [Streptomyces sp. NPDC002758]